MNKKVIVMSGIPGSGKSTWATNNYSKALYCSADNYFIKDGLYDFDASKLSKAHNYCMKKFLESIDYLENEQESEEEFNTRLEQDGWDPIIVVDNTNLSKWEASPYIAVAKAKDFEIEVVRIISINPDIAAGRNTHGVPYNKVLEMHNRMESFPKYWNVRIIEQ